MFLPYHVDVPMVRLPWANWLLLAVTCAVSLALFGGWRPGKEPPRPAVVKETPPAPQPKAPAKGARPGKAPQPSDEERLRQFLAEAEHEEEEEIPPLALRRGAGFRLPQLVTHLFVHGDLLHLVGNMLFLFVFGNAVNAKLGHAGFLASYFYLGALAGAAWLLVGDGPAVVGASGAIMGLVGVFLFLFPRNEICVFYWWLGRPGTLTVAAGWVILFYVVCDLLGTLLDAGGGVAYIAHLAGTVGGAVLAVGLLELGLIRSTEYEENLLQVLGWQKKTRRRRRKPRDVPTIR